MLERVQKAVQIALFVCLVCGFGLAVFSATQSQKNHRPESERAKKPDQVTATVSTEERLANYTLAVAILTGVLAGSTIGLWIVTYFTLRHGRQTAERELRAYVLIDNVKFARPKTDDGDQRHWGVHIVFRNFGKTPAYAAVMKAERKLFKNPPDDIFVPLSATADATPAVTIAPGHVYTMTLGGLTHGLRDFIEARNSEQVCLCWGRVDYFDTFGQERFSTFQMACNFGQVQQFGYCQKGNGTDDRFRKGRFWWNRAAVPVPT